MFICNFEINFFRFLFYNFHFLLCPLYRNGASGVLGIWREWLFSLRELESTGNYFQGSGEQAHSFGDLGSPAKKFLKNSP